MIKTAVELPTGESLVGTSAWTGGDVTTVYSAITDQVMTTED